MSAFDALARIRCTAALVTCAPTISARLVHGERVLVEVMRPPHPVRDHLVAPPRRFRTLVAQLAHVGAGNGRADARLLEEVLGARVELGVRRGTHLLAANVLRFDTGAAWVHLLALAWPTEAVRPAAIAVAREHAGDNSDSLLELHGDHELGVTVAGLASSRDELASATAADVLRTIGMRLAVERLELELRSMANHPANGAERYGPGHGAGR